MRGGAGNDPYCAAILRSGRASASQPRPGGSLRARRSITAFVVAAMLACAGCWRSPLQREARFLELGKKLLAKRDYARANLEFRNAIQIMPRDAEAYYQL